MATFRDPSTTADTGMRSARMQAGEMQEKAGEAMEQAQDMASEQFDRLQESIRRNPLAAAGIAAGIGFLLALLARR